MITSVRKRGVATLIAAAAVFAAVPGVAGATDRHEPSHREATIVDLAVATPQLSILVQAVQKAGLVETLSDPNADFTVFAPTNDAFVKLLKKLGLTSLDQIPVATLKAVLLDHVTVGSNSSRWLSLFDRQDWTENAIGGLKLEFDRSPLSVNEANITTADVVAQNGIIHIIDTVLSDPDPRPTIAELAIATPSLSILTAAVVKAGLLPAITDRDATLTVFAPTNDAFVALLGQLKLTSLDQVPVDTLKAILLDHIVPKELDAVDVLERAGRKRGAWTLGDLRLRFKTSPLQVNGANIIATDIEAVNGTVHVIDKVLLDPHN